MTKSTTTIQGIGEFSAENSEIFFTDISLLTKDHALDHAFHRSAEALLNNIELFVVKAMIAFDACVQNVDEATIGSMLSAAFGVEDVKKLPSKHYDEAIKFLVDLRVNRNVN